MKRILLVAGLLGLLAVASACGGGGSKQVTLPGGGDVKVTSGGDLPSDFPGDFPIFTGANLIGTATGGQGGQTGYVVTWETDASADDVTNFYKDALDKDPWTTSGTFTSGQGSVITFARTDGKDLGGGVTVSSDGKTQVAVFMGQGTGIGATAEAGQGEQATPTPKKATTPQKGATPQTESTPAQAALPDEVQLPNGYPTDVAPIPSGARVTDASTYTSGGQTSYTIKLLTQDDAQSVADFYSSKVPGNGWSEVGQGSSGGQNYANYQNEAIGGSLILTVGPSADYEGYAEADILLTVGQQ